MRRAFFVIAGLLAVAPLSSVFGQTNWDAHRRVAPKPKPCDYKRISPEELEAKIAVSRAVGDSEAEIQAQIAQIRKMEARTILQLEADKNCKVL